MGEGGDDDIGRGDIRLAVDRGGRLKKYLCRFVVGLIVAMLFAWAAVNLVLNHSWAKRKIESKASQAIGSPVRVGRIVAMPWGTLSLADLRLVVPEEGGMAEMPPIASCGEMLIVVEPLSLLTREVRFRRIEFADPVISLIRSGSGGLLLPKPGVELSSQPGKGEALPGTVAATGSGDEEAPDGGGASAGLSSMLVMPAGAVGATVSEESVLAEASAQEDEAESLSPVGGNETDERGAGADGPASKAVHPIVVRFNGREFHFRELVLRRGVMQVTSIETGDELLRVEDLEMTVDVGPQPRRPGRVTASRVSFLDAVEVEAIEGEVNSNGIWLDFDNLRADCFGGVVEGKARASPFFGGVPFLAGVRVKEVAVKEIASRIFPEAAIDEGMLGGEIRVLGRLRHPSSYRGSGTFNVEGAHIGKGRLLEPISKVVDVTALENVSFDDVSLKFIIGGWNIGVEDLRVASPDITLAGRGYVRAHGPLNVAIRLYLSDKAFHAVRMIEGRLPEGFALGFAPFAGSEERYFRDYLIEGNLSDPTVNFWDPAVMVRVAEMKEQIARLLKGSIEKGREEN